MGIAIIPPSWNWATSYLFHSKSWFIDSITILTSWHPTSEVVGSLESTEVNSNSRFVEVDGSLGFTEVDGCLGSTTRRLRFGSCSGLADHLSLRLRRN